jgi:hypothetical protein
MCDSRVACRVQLRSTRWSRRIRAVPFEALLSSGVIASLGTCFPSAAPGWLAAERACIGPSAAGAGLPACSLFFSASFSLCLVYLDCPSPAPSKPDLAAAPISFMYRGIPRPVHEPSVRRPAGCTQQLVTQMFVPALVRGYPMVRGPRRIASHLLLMPALKLSHPLGTLI